VPCTNSFSDYNPGKLLDLHVVAQDEILKLSVILFSGWKCYRHICCRQFIPMTRDMWTKFNRLLKLWMSLNILKTVCGNFLKFLLQWGAFKFYYLNITIHTKFTYWLSVVFSKEFFFWIQFIKKWVGFESVIIRMVSVLLPTNVKVLVQNDCGIVGCLDLLTIRSPTTVYQT
jgi:hypothetical protein